MRPATIVSLTALFLIGISWLVQFGGGGAFLAMIPNMTALGLFMANFVWMRKTREWEEPEDDEE